MIVSFLVRIDTTGGEQQAFIYDCEVCCRPIQIQLELKAHEILSFNAEPVD